MTNLVTPTKIRELQRKLYCKAKASPEFRFYQLYDKIWRQDILEHAWALARSNRGAPGVDGVDFEAIEVAGLQDWLKGVQEELRDKCYKPSAVRRVMIPKAGGGQRPLGILTIKDRVIQTAAKLVLDPSLKQTWSQALGVTAPNAALWMRSNRYTKHSSKATPKWSMRICQSTLTPSHTKS